MMDILRKNKIAQVRRTLNLYRNIASTTGIRGRSDPGRIDTSNMDIREKLCWIIALIIEAVRRLGIYRDIASTMNIRQRLSFCWDLISTDIISKRILVIIVYLKRVNKMADEFLSDAHERAKINMLVKSLRLPDYIDFHYFDDIYKIFVERKRRKILEDVNAIDEGYWEYRSRCESEGLPHEAMPVEKRMEEAVLETYYAFLGDDDAYQQKAFLEFLKKKIEDGDDRKEIADYLEKKYKHASYDEYERLEAYTDSILEIELPDLWIEFFRSGVGYTSMIPDERPPVAYMYSHIGIPRFIFERPYVKEFTEQEFYCRFMKEWDVTHENPIYDDEYDDPSYQQDYDMELADRPQRAYSRYMMAVSRFKRIQETLGQDGRSEHHPQK